jgi:hypothetical protein
MRTQLPTGPARRRRSPGARVARSASACVNSLPGYRGSFFVGPIGVRTLALVPNHSPDFLDDNALRSIRERRCDLVGFAKKNALRAEISRDNRPTLIDWNVILSIVATKSSLRRPGQEGQHLWTPGRDSRHRGLGMLGLRIDAVIRHLLGILEAHARDQRGS